MSDLTELFVLLAALYLAECVMRAPRGAVAFFPWFWSGWRILNGSSFYGNQRWGLFLSNPLPDLGTTIVCELWPISFSPDGVYSYVAQAFNPGARHEQPAVFHRFEDIRSAEHEGRDVLVNGQVFVTTASTLSADRLSGQIRRIGRLPLSARQAGIEAALRESLDVKAVRARVEEFNAATSWLGMACNLLFVHLFVVFPWVALQYGLEMTWLMLLGGLLLLVVIVLALYQRGHRRLYPNWKSDRRSHMATMLLLPLAAMRAPALLARHLLAVYHPLAVARVLCSEQVFVDFAASMLRDVRHPIAPPGPSEEFGPAATEESFRGQLAVVLEEFLAREGFDPERLTAPPARDEDALCYCPRCHCQFIIPEGQCEACNLPLVRLADAFK